MSEEAKSLPFGSEGDSHQSIIRFVAAASVKKRITLDASPSADHRVVRNVVRLSFSVYVG